MEVSSMKGDVGMNCKWVKIKDICFIHGGNPSPKEEEFASEGIPFIKMKDLGKYHHTTSLEVVENRIPLELFNSRKFKVIKKGSVIIPRSGSVGLNHRGILAFDSIIVSHICALEIIDDKLVFNKFLYYYLTTIDMVKITKQTTGLDAITFEDLAQIQIPLPPLSTQKRIAEILDAADALRRKDQELLKKYDELAQAIFIDMFGDPVKNEKGWEVKTIKSATNLLTYGLTVRPKYIENGFPLISARELRNGNVNFEDAPKISYTDYSNLSNKCKPKKGDILFSKTGSIGLSAIVEGGQEFAVTQNAARINFKNDFYETYFIYALLRQESFINKCVSLVKGNAVKDLQLGDFSEIEIICPPLSKQIEFSGIYQKTNQSIKKSNDNYIVSDDLFNSVIQKAFNGELV